MAAEHLVGKAYLKHHQERLSVARSERNVASAFMLSEVMVMSAPTLCAICGGDTRGAGRPWHRSRPDDLSIIGVSATSAPIGQDGMQWY